MFRLFLINHLNNLTIERFLTPLHFFIIKFKKIYRQFCNYIMPLCKLMHYVRINNVTTSQKCVFQLCVLSV